MRQRAELRQRQKQQFNARFCNAVQILQMPNAELAQEVQDHLDTNPMLEEVEFDDPGELDHFFSFPTLSPFDISGSGTSSSQLLEYEAYSVRSQTICEYLHDQINQSGLTGQWRGVAEAIADSVDDRGYFTDSHEELLNALGDGISVDFVEQVLRVVQKFDPPGVASRSLGECLINQLNFTEAPAPVLRNARRIIENWLDELSNLKYNEISEALGIGADEVRDAANLIQTLNPNPGSGFGESARIIVPDVIARKVEGRWRIGLNSEVLPRIGISSIYRSMISNDSKSQSSEYLKKNLSGANVFLESLNRRHQTVLRVARELVMFQQRFLEYGDHALQPLKISEISDRLDLHESTVSRACSGKYIMAPRGTFEMKKFFSYRLKNVTGSDESARSVQLKVANLVEGENCKNPLSDQQITNMLRESGIQIARRTVAKYRLQMKIPPRNWRKANALN